MPTPAPIGLVGKLADLDAPRSPQGCRHNLASLLLCAPCAILAGVRCLRAIGQWTDTAPQHTLTPDRHLVAQVRVPAGTSEIDALEPLLAGVGLAGVVLTADALHTQTGTAAYLVEELHADYVLNVKRNQKTLFEQVAVLPRAQAPTLATTRDHGHGRAETRIVKAIDLVGATGFPHAVQAVCLHRYVRDMRTGKASWTVAYAVTSLGVVWAGAARIGALVRGHWNIEAWHHVEDVSLGEDACKVGEPGRAASYRPGVLEWPGAGHRARRDPVGVA